MILNTAVHIPEHPVYQKPPTMPIQDLCEQVSMVLICWDKGNEGVIHCNGLTYCMIADQVWLLLECRHIVPIDLWGIVHWDVHHSELVVNAMQICNAVPQGANLAPITEASIMDYLFKNQSIIPWLRKMTNLVLERRLILSPAWLLDIGQVSTARSSIHFK